MTNISKIAEALAKAQSEMTGAKKDSENPHFKKSYADLESVVSAVRAPLTSNGIAFIQPFGRDEIGDYCDTIFIHKTGETLKSRIYLAVDRDNMQGLGSAQTYARRYGLMGLAGIAPEDDDGNAAASAPPPKATDSEIKQAIEQINACGDLDALKNVFSAIYTNARHVADHVDVVKAKDARKAELQAKPADEALKDDAKFLEET